MNYIEFDNTRPFDLVLLGRVAIDFNPAYNDQVKEEFKPLKKVHMFEKYPTEEQADGQTIYGTQNTLEKYFATLQAFAPPKTINKSKFSWVSISDIFLSSNKEKLFLEI